MGNVTLKPICIILKSKSKYINFLFSKSEKKAKIKQRQELSLKAIWNQKEPRKGALENRYSTKL